MTLAALWQTCWDWLVRGETLFSLLAMIFAAMATIQLWMQRRHQRNMIRQVCQTSSFVEYSQALRGVKSDKPKALAISVSSRTSSIMKDVKEFLDLQNWRMEFDSLEMVDIGQGNEAKDPVIDVEQFLRLLLEKRALYDLEGVTELHLFVQAPVSLAIFLGAVFDHWKPVKLYQKRLEPSPPMYEYWGLLSKRG